MVTYSYLQREEVLKYIDTLHFRTQYIRIIVLDNKERPLRAIEGRATGGSINVNGSSAVRRSGNITLVTALNEEIKTPLDIMNEVTNIDTLISMNKRLQIEIGIENSGNQFKEEEIFWIPFGVFIIQNASVAYNNQGIQISLKLTDKMALLNGELGGTFYQAITHSPMGEYADGSQAIVNKGVKFRTLIEYLLRDFGELQPYEYSIENIPDTVKNIIRWNNSKKQLKINVLGTEIQQDDLTILTQENFELTEDKVNHVENIYGYADAVGYTETDFVYPLDKTLDSKPGETVTSVLDKIKNTLGNYEYFFDIAGIFRFREIPNFLNEGSSIDDLTQAIAEKYFVNVDTSAGRAVYRFNDAALISSYGNNPQYNQIKNDYSVWGKTPQTEQDIWYHLLLIGAPDDYSDQVWELEVEDGKIISAKKLNPSESNAQNFIEQNADTGKWIVNFLAPTRPGRKGDHKKDDDWRLKFYLRAIAKSSTERTPFDKEVIEKMPTLYRLENFDEIKKPFFEPIYDKNTLTYWLDIVNTNDYKITKTLEVKQFGIESIGRKVKTITDDDVNCLFYSDVPKYLLYAPQGSQSEFVIKGKYIPSDNFSRYQEEHGLTYAKGYFTDGSTTSAPEPVEGGWKSIIKLGPNGIWEQHEKDANGQDKSYICPTPNGRYNGKTLKYIEFAKEDGEDPPSEKYNFTKWFVQNFEGYDDESKEYLKKLSMLVNDSWKPNESEDKDLSFWESVALGTVENSAYDLLRSSLHEHLSYNNSINLTTMPVYHLDANDRISVYNKESDIYGDYIINSLTIPLGLDGMMTINARKAVERI